MRPLTFRYIVGLAVVGAVVHTGCSTDNGPPAQAAEAPPAAPAPEKTADNTEPPPFVPDFPDAATPSDDATAPGPCIDTDDPGGTEAVAKELSKTDDCKDNFTTVSGVMNGAVDVDVYKLSASDEFGCLMEAEFKGDTAGTELCVYARCKNSTTDAVTGCASGTSNTNDIGMKGCCAAAPGQAVPEWDCSGISDDDSAEFFIQVKQLNGDSCLPYKFRYRF